MPATDEGIKRVPAAEEPQTTEPETEVYVTDEEDTGHNGDDEHLCEMGRFLKEAIRENRFSL